MDPRLDLLREFSTGFAPGTVKLETERHGFAFLDELLSGGARLEYGELTPTRLLHKYKLSGVSDARLDDFLRDHLAGTCNVCRYFAPEANRAFCFNLDNNRKADNTRVIPEMELAVGSLRRSLTEAGCRPLVVASGRGFHLWCLLEGPVANARLHDFMVRAAVRALADFRGTSLDRRQVKFNFYPDSRITDVVSLRLFGSLHSKNRVFSRVLSPDGLLDRDASWAAFEDLVRRGRMPLDAFAAAEAALRAPSDS